VPRNGELGTTLAVIHGVTSQKTPFFIVTDVKTSNLTSDKLYYNFKVHPFYVCLLKTSHMHRTHGGHAKTCNVHVTLDLFVGLE
jgi:hypothetical protein